MLVHPAYGDLVRAHHDALEDAAVDIALAKALVARSEKAE
jgi:hypothetical protein